MGFSDGRTPVVARGLGLLIRAVVLAMALGWMPLALDAASSPVIRAGSVILNPDGGGFSFQFETDPDAYVGFGIQAGSTVGGEAGWQAIPEGMVAELVPGVYQVSVPASATEARRFYRVVAALNPPPKLRITEVMSDNVTATPDGTNAYWDWIEIYNPNDVAVDMLGYGLSDSEAALRRWTFPEVFLGPRRYLVVYASGLDRREPGAALHTNFKVSSGGETLFLTGSDGSILDMVVVPALGHDESWGLAPRGTDGTWLVYSKAQITPGKANSAVTNAAPVFAPVFPSGSQFLPGGSVFRLEIHAPSPGSSIRFTTNGDPVTAQSPAYTGGLVLSNTVVIRAKAFLGTQSSPETMRTYFFGVQHSLPVVSLAAPAGNFEFKNGYLFGMGPNVLGPSGEVLQSYPFSGSNAWQDREIEVGTEFFETDGDVKFRQRLGMAVFGAWGSRGYPQKSVALFAREAYGDGKINYKIFPYRDNDKFESIVLRVSGNDNQGTHQTAPRAPITQFGPVFSYGSYFVNGNFTMMRDAMEQRLLQDTGLDTQAYRPAVVYLNGEYWGIYNLREKVAEDYVLANHGFLSGEVDLLEGYGSVMAGDGVAYSAMKSFLANKDLKTAANYNTVAAQYLDIDNFIDYHLAVIYFQNFDIGNIKCWRSRAGDGRFRWIVYDQDYGFNLWRPDIYLPAMARDYADYDNMFKFSTASTGTGTGWPNEGGRTLFLRRMLLNDTFKAKLIQRCADLLNTSFREERVVGIIDSMAAVIRPEIPRHLERWSWGELKKRGYAAPYKPEYAPFTQATWETNIAVLSDFAKARPAKLRRDCTNHFKLLKGFSQISVDVVPAGGGSIQLNTSVARSFPWAGVFFRDYPVALAAVPAAGYRFMGWSGPAFTTNTPRWTLSLPGATHAFVATFEPHDSAVPVNPPLVITEFHYHPGSQEESGDWIELHNPGPSPIQTTGWILRDKDDAHEFVLPISSIGPGGYLVLCQDTVRFRRVHPTVTNCIGNFPFGLDNSGDTIRLWDPTGVRVQELSFSDGAPWPSGADGSGHSLQLIDPDAYTGDPAGWKISPAVGGSPGQPNP